jgi:hypothetical protein
MQAMEIQTGDDTRLTEGQAVSAARRSGELQRRDAAGGSERVHGRRLRDTSDGEYA